MKLTLPFLTILTFVLSLQKALAQTEQPGEPTRSATEATINSQYLKLIKPIFQKKCFDCHSNQTVFPWYYAIPFVKAAMDEHIEDGLNDLDLTNDYPFAGVGDSPDNMLQRLRECIEKKEMPLFSYRLIHWSSGITDAEQKDILNWIDNSRNLLKANAD